MLDPYDAVTHISVVNLSVRDLDDVVTHFGVVNSNVRDPDDVVTHIGVVNSSVRDARLIALKCCPDGGHRRAKTHHFNYNYNDRLPTKGHGLVILDQQGV